MQKNFFCMGDANVRREMKCSNSGFRKLVPSVAILQKPEWGLCQSFEISQGIDRLKGLIEYVQNPKWDDVKPTR